VGLYLAEIQIVAKRAFGVYEPECHKTKKRASQRASLLIIYEFFEICMYLNNQ
jgi:hypothetical protein